MILNLSISFKNNVSMGSQGYAGVLIIFGAVQYKTVYKVAHY